MLDVLKTDLLGLFLNNMPLKPSRNIIFKVQTSWNMVKNQARELEINITNVG